MEINKIDNDTIEISEVISRRISKDELLRDKAIYEERLQETIDKLKLLE